MTSSRLSFAAMKIDGLEIFSRHFFRANAWYKVIQDLPFMPLGHFRTIFRAPDIHVYSNK